MLLVNGIRTLFDVVIVNATRAKLVFRVVSSREMAMMVAIQAKKRLYHNQHPTNTFLPLAIEVFEWLYQQANNFFHQCASMVWLAKGLSGLPSVILCAFYR